jgi:hypothetical protein
MMAMFRYSKKERKNWVLFFSFAINEKMFKSQYIDIAVLVQNMFI